MAKTASYRWRVTPQLKGELEAAAQRRGLTVAELLERIAEAWLMESRELKPLDEHEQERIHREAMKWVGSIEGLDPDRSARVSELVRESLHDRHRATQRSS